MSYRWLAILVALAALMAVPLSAAVAQEDSDATMDVVESTDADEREAVEEIALPEDAAAEAVENAAFGIETANEAREQGEEFGRDVAESAREAGKSAREAGADVGDEVRDEAGDPTDPTVGTPAP